MDDQPRKRRPPSRLGKGPTAGSFKPGVSGNPAGRPRTGQAFAEKVRERVNPDLVIDLAMRVADDEKLDPRERLAALWPLVDRGFTKPPTDLNLGRSDEPELDLSALSTDEVAEYLRLVEKATSTGDPRLTEPQGADDDRARDTRRGTLTPDNTAESPTTSPERAA